MIQVYIERNGRKNPYENIPVWQECKQSTTDTENDRPVCKDGKPASLVSLNNCKKTR